jgi:LPXTG-site transpeptidase (sortase) family protein
MKRILSLFTLLTLCAALFISASAAAELYPAEIQEVRNDDGQQIVKTYALDPTDDPAGISRADFERDNWRYTLTDIVKKETATGDEKEYIETVTQPSDTNDLETILTVLSSTIDFTSEDGYVGTLLLDVSSIKVETAGTKTGSYTVTATREYPNLPSNDSSFVVKTITDGGRTLSLADIQWGAVVSSGDAYGESGESWTAVATYTADATRTVVTGYTVTADYTGTARKLISGKTLYTAYFLGTAIAPPEQVPDDAVYAATDAVPGTSNITVNTPIVTAPSYYADGSVGSIYIPRFSKTIRVYEGESLENMRKGIGHFTATSTWDGNVGVAGHNRGAAAYFSFVKDLAIGDIITYTTLYGVRTYEIYRKDKIAETDFSSLGWSAENIITLITCVEDVPALRWCVQARQIL